MIWICHYNSIILKQKQCKCITKDTDNDNLIINLTREVLVYSVPSCCKCYSIQRKDTTVLDKLQPLGTVSSRMFDDFLFWQQQQYLLPLPAMKLSVLQLYVQTFSSLETSVAAVGWTLELMISPSCTLMEPRSRAQLYKQKAKQGNSTYKTFRVFTLSCFSSTIRQIPLLWLQLVRCEP